ncbi:MAG: transposase [Planctomycetes bacterium]|jgi:REP element-mobilizing transposase RayT|nr:transposase [Planctomycetota bacterium]
MARPLRIEYAGAYYHVMNRGNGHQTVFVEPPDYELFLARLGQFSAQFEVRVLCYCCMPNHFHLYLRTPQANLSRFMQSLLTAFSISFNRRHESTGHVFQGRFAAHLVENEAYGAEVSRYVHLNPVRTKALRPASLVVRRQALRSFAWSSYAACIGLAPGPAWFDPGELLSDWGATRRTQMRRYAEYTEEGLLRDLDNPLTRLEAQTILGTDSFVDRVRRAYVLTRTADPREQPACARARHAVPFATVVRCVSQVCGVKPDRLLARRGADRRARQLLLYGVCHHCRGTESLTALARRLGVSLSGLTMARDRATERLRDDRRLQHTWRQIEQQLQALAEK